LNPKDELGFNDLLESYNIPEDLQSYELLAKRAMEFPRYSFRLTMSALSKLVKK
jgi:hypothetical protein